MNWLVYLIIAAAVAYAARRLWITARAWKQGKAMQACGCGCSGQCPGCCAQAPDLFRSDGNGKS